MPAEIALAYRRKCFQSKGLFQSKCLRHLAVHSIHRKNYGLKQNWWYDERRDIVAATGAALDYLQNLIACLATGNWCWLHIMG